MYLGRTQAKLEMVIFLLFLMCMIVAFLTGRLWEREIHGDKCCNWIMHDYHNEEK